MRKFITLIGVGPLVGLLVVGNSFANGRFDCLKEQPFATAVNFEKTECEEAYHLGQSLMPEFKEDRRNIMKEVLGVAFQNSLVKGVNDMAQVDFLHIYFDKDYGSTNTCSLSKAYQDFPCLKENNEYLKEITKGRFKDVKALFSSIAESYSEKVSGYTNLNAKECLNPFLRKKLAMDEFFHTNKDINLKKLIQNVSQESPDPKEVKIYRFLTQHFDVIKGLSLDDVEGSTFKEQVESLISQAENKKTLEDNVYGACEKMISRVSQIVCKPLNKDRVDNPEFNNIVFDYDTESFEGGFDEFEAELGAISVEKSYGHFVLNCEPKCEGNCEGEHGLDEILEENFSEDFGELVSYEDQEKEFNNSEYDGELCPLLACENGLEAQEGAACEQRSQPRSLEEIKTYLNCEEDEYCNEQKVASFINIISRQEEILSQEEGATSIKTSFTRSFLGEEFSEEKAPEVITTQIEQRRPEHTPLTTVEASKEIRERVSRAVVKKAAKETRAIVKNEPSKNTQNATSAPLKEVTNESPRSKYNQADRDLFSAMGGILRDAVESQEKSNKVYNQNLEELVSANRELESRINEKLGESKKDRAARPINSRGQAFTGPAPMNVPSANEGNNAWSDAITRNRELNDRWDAMQRSRVTESGGQGDQEPFETNPARPRRGGSGQGGVSASGAEPGRAPASLVAGGSGAGQGESGKTEDRAEGLAGIGTASFNLEDLKAIETSLNGISQMDQNRLIKEGLSLEEPFLIRVKVEDKTLVVPVKPFLYKGNQMLAPVMDQDNYILSDVLRKSPLFIGYYQYERERQGQLSWR